MSKKPKPKDSLIASTGIKWIVDTGPKVDDIGTVSDAHKRYDLLCAERDYRYELGDATSYWKFLCDKYSVVYELLHYVCLMESRDVLEVLSKLRLAIGIMEGGVDHGDGLPNKLLESAVGDLVRLRSVGLAEGRSMQETNLPISPALTRAAAATGPRRA